MNWASMSWRLQPDGPVEAVAAGRVGVEVAGGGDCVVIWVGVASKVVAGLGDAECPLPGSCDDGGVEVMVGAADGERDGDGIGDVVAVGDAPAHPAKMMTTTAIRQTIAAISN